MSTGLLALLDDVAAPVKVSAASLDDIPTQVARTTGKVSGIVIDDAAVTPKYVVGLDPKRELSIIYQIAKKSVINKLIFLGPAALLLGYFAPAAIPYVLMVGGAYLCFEGYEKVHSIFSKSSHAMDQQPTAEMKVITPEELEKSGWEVPCELTSSFRPRLWPLPTPRSPKVRWSTKSWCCS